MDTNLIYFLLFVFVVATAQAAASFLDYLLLGQVRRISMFIYFKFLVNAIQCVFLTTVVEPRTLFMALTKDIPATTSTLLTIVSFIGFPLFLGLAKQSGHLQRWSSTEDFQTIYLVHIGFYNVIFCLHLYMRMFP